MINIEIDKVKQQKPFWAFYCPEEATRLNEANGNDVEDLVHCVIIEDKDAASTTVTEGTIEMFVLLYIQKYTIFLKMSISWSEIYLN